MNTAPRQRDPFLEFSRFLGATVIMGHHICFYTEGGARTNFFSGWIFVEFFYMLTGYFSTAHFARLKDYDVEDIFSYCFQKIWRIFPFAFLGVMCSFFCELVKRWAGGPYEWVRMVLDLPLSCIFWGNSLSSGNVYSGQLWYMGVLALALPVSLLLMTHFHKLYQHLLCWSVPILSYTVAIVRYGSIVAFNPITCLIRGISGVCLGSALFYMGEHLQCKINEPARMAAKVTKYICLIFILVSQYYWDFYSSAAGYILVVFLMIFAACCSPAPTGGEVAERFGQLSMPIYCLHNAVMEAVWLCVPDYSMGLRFGISLIVVCALSIILLRLLPQSNRMRR